MVVVVVAIVVVAAGAGAGEPLILFIPSRDDAVGRSIPRAEYILYTS